MSSKSPKSIIKQNGSRTPSSIIKDIKKEYLDKEGVRLFLDHNTDSDSARMGVPYSYDKENALLTIFVSNILGYKNGKKVLLEMIRDIHEEGYLIFKNKKLKEFKSYQDYCESKSNNDVTILKFFKDIISTEDHLALKASLFIEYLATKGINIYYHKYDLRERFGPRGTNIANLCSANYFTDVFMPMHNEVDRAEFVKYYELAVGQRAIALFVNKHMSVVDIQDAVSMMVDKIIMYGFDDFHIHGKGKTNIDKIKKFVAEIKPEKDQYIAIKVPMDGQLNVIEFIIELI